MQALCPACNVRKGATMNQIDTSKLRIGQRLAVSRIVERIRAGQTHTAIVLPTRYGKTDVMRVAGMMLIPDYISRALILVPNTYLRAQVVDQRKWLKSATSYNLRAGLRGIPIAEATKPPVPPFPRENALFVSMTMQMAQRYKELLVQWVDSERNRFGVPPLIYVDEAHTGSTENQWGRCVEELAQAGAFVVLLTATPFRTDEEHIPGFELEQVNVANVIQRRKSTLDPEGWDIFGGRKRVFQLKAHHTTTFREAWSTENDPPVLCDITRRPFDIAVEEIAALTGEFRMDRRLSQLSAAQARRVLDLGLREPRIINQACEIMVKVLEIRQKDEPETAAMVFVGNDKPGDEGDNRHAEDVKAAIQKLASGLRVEIATSSTPQADKTIERFVQRTDIDVLIVKQMAGLGVDADRLKVCLDLSNVRTLNAFIQRVTRIATVWDRRPVTGREWDIVAKAEYITPDDTVGLQLYNHFIRDQGGGVTRLDMEYVETVQNGNGAGEWIPPNDVIAREVITPEEVQDTKLQVVPGQTLSTTDRVFDALPELTKTRTQPDLALALQKAGVEVQGLDSNGAAAPAVERNAPTSEPVIRNINSENAAVRKEMDVVTKQITTQILGRPYGSGHREYIEKLRGGQDQVQEHVWHPVEPEAGGCQLGPAQKNVEADEGRVALRQEE